MAIMVKPYFHEISQTEIDKLISKGKTIAYVLKHFKQPEWCGYPNALSGKWGCWSLNDCTIGGTRTKISKEFCKNCDAYKK